MRYAGGFVTKYGVDPTSKSSSARASGVWHLSDITKYQATDSWPTAGFYPAGETIYTIPDTYTFKVPEGVTQVSVVCVGPGHSSTSGTDTGNSSFGSYVIAEGGGKIANGGKSAAGLFYPTGTRSGTAFTGGGSGGHGAVGGSNYGGGGGGAGGYSGAGGNADDPGLGGGGGGGATSGGDSGWYGSGGGGVGLFGQGTSGPRPTLNSGYGTHGGPGRPGSGGGEGTNSQTSGAGGDYGGGAGAYTGDGGAGGALVYGNNIPVTPGQSITVVVGASDRSKTAFPANGGGDGAVRVIWARASSGITRIFPSTNVGQLTGDSPIVSPIISAPAGQQEFIVPGTWQFIAPQGVTSVSVVTVGAGGLGGSGATGGGAGGGLAWKNNIAVVPGQTYTVVVGEPNGINAPNRNNYQLASGSSYFISTGTVGASGGTGPGGGAYYGTGNWTSIPGTILAGDGGGTGGTNAPAPNGTWSWGGGGHGAAGYTGNGGIGGGHGAGSDGTAGSGGGGGGGSISVTVGGGGGGGVGLLGLGANGAGGSDNTGSPSGKAGSGGTNGTFGSSGWGGNGGLYGGGGGSQGVDGAQLAMSTGGLGGGGAVRIIWAGTSGITRAYPSTNTGNL